MRVVIIDDEIDALESLEYDMDEYCPEFEIIGKFDNPVEAVGFINSNKPDIVLSDIQMPRMDAFAMIEALEYRDFELILVTAYNKYAVRAFEFSDSVLVALDACEAFATEVHPDSMTFFSGITSSPSFSVAHQLKLFSVSKT